MRSIDPPQNGAVNGAVEKADVEVRCSHNDERCPRELSLRVIAQRYYRRVRILFNYKCQYDPSPYISTM